MADGTVGVRQAGDADRLIDNEVLINDIGATVWRQRVATVPARQKKHIEFIPSSAAPTTIYTGYAPNGTADGAAAWTIQRIVFTGTTNIDETWTATSTAVWSNRATETYT